MNPDKQRIDSIFLAAAEKATPDERAAYLDSACGTDTELRKRVERLLTAQSKVGSFLEAPAAGLPSPPSARGVGGEGVGATVDEPPITEVVGTRLGPYKLLEQIGEGGMGTVWMAEQQEPVRRMVAVKVIKAGMDSAQVIARFEAERQALALMDHPNIAKVLDAGTIGSEPRTQRSGVSGPPEPLTPLGCVRGSDRPFFVMELVKGTPITKYCDEHRLTPRQRLELFVPVCQAIQHAHQKGIIHRDVKPSNVLVAPYDGKPVVKVIDFGVAKATGQRLTERTLFTGFGAVVGTLEYMSPEQAELNNQDIDTRSDIYSLGVLLYELLTGTTPLTKERLKQAGFTEMLRIIREEEPPKPSTRLSSSDTLPAIAAARRTEPEKLTRLVRGELDWIVLKALEKDRNRRYETANGLARDIERYLHDEPVVACPPSMGYRLRKFARRNRAALTTLVVVAAALLITVVSLVLSNISIRQEEKEKSDALLAKEAALRAANTNREKAEANLILILAALDDVYITEAEKRFRAYRNEPNKSTPTQDPRKAQLDRDFLQKGLNFYEKLIQPGSAEPAARFQTGKAYRRVGILQWELKQHEEAADSLVKAVSLLHKLVEESPTEAQYRGELADAYRWQGNVCLKIEIPRPGEAETPYRRALALLDGLVDEFPTRADYRMQAATCRVSMAMGLRMMRRIEEAELLYLEALKRWQQLVDEFPNDRWYRHELANNLDTLGYLWQETANRPEKAEPFFRQALDYHDKLVAEDPTAAENCERLGRTYKRLGEVLTAQGKNAEAEKVYRQAIGSFEKLARINPKLAGHRQGLARFYSDLRQWDKVIKNCTEAIELEPQRSELWSLRAFARFALQKWDDCIQDYTKAIELAPHVHTNWWHRGLAYSELGQWDNAVTDFSNLLKRYPDDYNAWHTRAVAYMKLNQPALAVADLRQAIAKGYKDLQGIDNDERFAPLRSREDFKKLLAEAELKLEKKAPPK
jgi:serine/threonine protein kinase